MGRYRGQQPDLRDKHSPKQLLGLIVPVHLRAGEHQTSKHPRRNKHTRIEKEYDQQPRDHLPLLGSVGTEPSVSE